MTLPITPTEAKDLMCPFRSSGSIDDVKCKAEGCMMWRWHDLNLRQLGHCALRDDTTSSSLLPHGAKP